MLSQLAEHARQKYQGDVASGYDVKRETQQKWHRENEILESFLSDLPKGTSVLDVPCGTGRFIRFYEKMGFNVLGLDINKDMLTEAAKKSTSDNTYFRTGDILKIDLPNKTVDVTVTVRMFRWLSEPEVCRALRELQRVAKKRIIFNARVANHPFARPLSLIKSALHPNWRIEREQEIEPDYIMFEMRCAG